MLSCCFKTLGLDVKPPTPLQIIKPMISQSFILAHFLLYSSLLQKAGADRPKVSNSVILSGGKHKGFKDLSLKENISNPILIASVSSPWSAYWDLVGILSGI